MIRVHSRRMAHGGYILFAQEDKGKGKRWSEWRDVFSHMIPLFFICLSRSHALHLLCDESISLAFYTGVIVYAGKGLSGLHLFSDGKGHWYMHSRSGWEWDYIACV